MILATCFHLAPMLLNCSSSLLFSSSSSRASVSRDMASSSLEIQHFKIYWNWIKGLILVNQIDQNDFLCISVLRRPLPAGEARLDSRVVSFHFQSQHFLLLFLQLTRSVRNDKSKHIHHSPRISSFQTTGPQSSVCSSKMWGIKSGKRGLTTVIWAGLKSSLVKVREAIQEAILTIQGGRGRP